MSSKGLTADGLRAGAGPLCALHPGAQEEHRRVRGWAVQLLDSCLLPETTLLARIPFAKPGRESTDFEIFGMSGIPEGMEPGKEMPGVGDGGQLVQLDAGSQSCYWLAHAVQRCRRGADGPQAAADVVRPGSASDAAAASQHTPAAAVPAAHLRPSATAVRPSAWMGCVWETAEQKSACQASE